MANYMRVCRRWGLGGGLYFVLEGNNKTFQLAFNLWPLYSLVLWKRNEYLKAQCVRASGGETKISPEPHLCFLSTGLCVCKYLGFGFEFQ